MLGAPEDTGSSFQAVLLPIPWGGSGKLVDVLHGAMFEYITPADLLRPSNRADTTTTTNYKYLRARWFWHDPSNTTIYLLFLFGQPPSTVASFFSLPSRL